MSTIIPKGITVGIDREAAPSARHYAYFIHDTVEYAWADGATQEEAVTKVADQLAERIKGIAILLRTPTHPEKV